MATRNKPAHVPTATEIARLCAEIRRSWTPSQRQQRRELAIAAQLRLLGIDHQVAA